MEANELREHSVAAWEAQQTANKTRMEAEEAAEEARLAAEQAPVLQEKLREVLGIQLKVTTRRVVIDGMQFGVEYSYGKMKLRAYPRCPKCGQRIFDSIDIDGEASVGYAFERQEDAVMCGRCRDAEYLASRAARESTPTPDETFLTAFRTWLQAERESE